MVRVKIIVRVHVPGYVNPIVAGSRNVDSFFFFFLSRDGRLSRQFLASYTESPPEEVDALLVRPPHMHESMLYALGSFPAGYSSYGNNRYYIYIF